MRKKCGFILTVILVLFAGCLDPVGTDKPKFPIAINGPFTGGTVRLKGNRRATEGEKITLIAVPAENGLCLDSVTVKGESGSVIGVSGIDVSGYRKERTFTMPSEPVTVTAVSFQQGYGITMAGQYSNGSVTSTDGSPYNAGYAVPGDIITLIIVPDEGYYLAAVIIKGKSTENEIPAKIDNRKNRITFIMPDEDVDIAGYENGLIFLPK